MTATLFGDEPTAPPAEAPRSPRTAETAAGGVKGAARIKGSCVCGRTWTSETVAHCPRCHVSYPTIALFDAHVCQPREAT